MNKIQHSFLVLCAFFLSGCVSNHQYQGSNFPPLSSSSYPSFSIVSEIKDGINVKLTEANGKTKVLMNFEITKGQQNTYVSGDIDWRWDINVENNLIYNNHSMEMVIKTPNERKSLNIKFDGIHETSGKEISMDVYFDNKEDEFTVEELNKLKKQMSIYIDDLFVSLGKTVKTGDVLKYVPNEISNMKRISDQNIKDKIPEVVKGLGVYENKRVVVTEYIFEDSLHNPDFIMEVRGKGYNLYDAETFILLFGEGVFYATAFSPKEGTIYFKVDGVIEAQDLQIRNIIHTADVTTNRNNDKKIAKPPWNEASDKIKSLWELFQKGLISKEEYENKKKDLLNNF